MTAHRVFISPIAQQELVNHFNDLLNNSSDDRSTYWLIEKLEDFLVNGLSQFPSSGLRQDAIDQGIRVQLYGFYEVYYYFNGKDVYIAHVSHDKALIQ